MNEKPADTHDTKIQSNTKIACTTTALPMNVYHTPLLKRTDLLMFALLLISALLFAPVMADTHGKSNAEFRTTKLASNLTLLQGKGGNIIAQTGPDGLVLIDNGYAEMSPKLSKALSQLHDGDNIRYIINTHWHGDHTGGNLTLGKQAPIIAHRMVRERLSVAQEIKAFGMKSEAYPAAALPSLVYEKQMSLFINNETLHIIHLANGHTDGDSVVFFPDSNVIHLGDQMFAGMFPFIDLDHGGNAYQLVNNLENLIPLLNANTQIVPGHGPLSTLEDLKNYITMLRSTIDYVREALNAGLPPEDIKAQGLPHVWDRYNNGFIKAPQWIDLIIDSLLDS